MHGILWAETTKEEVEAIWSYGFVWEGKFVNERTINYIVKYIHKIDEDHKGYKPIVLTSAGIGKNYIERGDAKNNQYKKGETDERYTFKNGRKSNLPIYYRNKIYTEAEREKLWIEKLDKKERWVGGEKVSGKRKDWENYEETRKYYAKNVS